MTHYRLYLLDFDNRITREGVEIECADDDAALLAASRIDHTSGVEVWSGTRRVARVSPA